MMHEECFSKWCYVCRQRLKTKISKVWRSTQDSARRGFVEILQSKERLFYSYSSIVQWNHSTTIMTVCKDIIDNYVEFDFRIQRMWPTWTPDPWPPSSPPAFCGWRRCSRCCSRCSTGFSASLSPFHKSPIFSWRSQLHCKPWFPPLELCRDWRLVLYCGGFQSCEEGLVGAIDGRRLPPDCSL